MDIEELYDKIAEHFDATRYSLWPAVVDFLQGIDAESRILDVGCGNGKYLSVRKDCEVHACDVCPKLVEIAKKKHTHANVIVANGMALPYFDKTFDVVTSIAVLHHIRSESGRDYFIQELMRVVKPGGKVYITVWATDAAKNKPKWIHVGNGDYHIPWTTKTGEIYMRYYHLYSREELEDIIKRRDLNADVTFESDNWHIEIRKPYKT